MPTIRQQYAIKKMVEKVGISKKPSITLKTILSEAGYSPSVCKTPKKVTQTKGWRQLLSESCPDTELISILRRLLYKQEVFIHKGKTIPTGQPHTDVKTTIAVILKTKGYFSNNVFEQDEEKNDIKNMPDTELWKLIFSQRYYLYDKSFYKSCKKYIKDYERLNKVNINN